MLYSLFLHTSVMRYSGTHRFYKNIYSLQNDIMYSESLKAFFIFFGGGVEIASMMIALNIEVAKI